MKADKDDLDQQELERRLAALPQPAPSAALDAAILAAVQADLAAARSRPSAANDAPIAPPAVQAPTRQRWTRWQLPLGLAASFVLSLSVVMKLQEHEAQVAAPQPPAAPSPSPSPAPAPAAPPNGADAAETAASTPAAESAAPAPQGSTADTRNRTQAKNSRPALPPNAATTATTRSGAAANAKAGAAAQAARQNSERAAPPMAVESAPAQEFRRPPQAVPELTMAVPAAPAMPSYSQPSPASAFSPAPVPAAAPSLAVPPAPPAPPPPPPAPHIVQDRAAPAEAAGRVASERRVEITGSRIMRPQPNAVSPDIWLSAIDEMLKAGLRRDALAEWPRFRQAYPDYPVPQELLERLRPAKE